MANIELNVISLIISFFGGGILGALINWIRAERSDNKERRIKFLDNQIRELYGPLYYLLFYGLWFQRGVGKLK